IVARPTAAVSAPQNSPHGARPIFSDFDDAVTITASTGSVSQVGSKSGTWSWSGSGDENTPYTVTITATNADSSTATTSFAVSFTDVTPTVGPTTAAVSPTADAPAT